MTPIISISSLANAFEPDPEPSTGIGRAMKPLAGATGMRFRRLPQAQTPVGQVLSGAYNATIPPTADFMSSPVGLASGGLGALPARALTGLGALMAPVSGYMGVQSFNRAANADNLQDATTGTVEGLAGLFGAAGGLAGGMRGMADEFLPHAAQSGMVRNPFPQSLGAPAERRMMKDALPTSASPSDYSARPTVENAQRVAFPGIYMNPRKLVSSVQIAPEDPIMKRLFGVTRDDLYQMSMAGTRQGNDPSVPFQVAAKPKGSELAPLVMNKKNEGRIIDILSEARNHPALEKGMVPWYVMDPLYDNFVRLYGPTIGAQKYSKFNTLTGQASPQSDVLTEYVRGTGAYYLDEQGRFSDFLKYGGLSAGKRGAGFPADMRAIVGHMGHSTSQAVPMQKYLNAGVIDMDSPKVPTYVKASEVPQTGFQTNWPVGDAHWIRGIGLPDVRPLKTIKGDKIVNAASGATAEMYSLSPWWRDKIASQVGLEAVPAQALLWGAGSRATGVDSPIAAPKLELLSKQIGAAANRLGVTPETARDMILMGKAHAGR